MFLKRLKIDQKWSNKPWIIFSPFLLLYLAISLVHIPNGLEADEPRYVRYAHNLLNGFLSPSDSAHLDLWSGPGYSLVISIFLLLKSPLIFVRLLNSILLYTSLLISFRTLRQFTTRNQALLYIIPLGLYFPIYEMLPAILTECFTWFLMSIITYLFVISIKQKLLGWKYILVTSLAIAYLALTKVIFGYVILFLLVISLFLCLFTNFRAIGKKYSLVFFFSLVFCLPYLVYTYSLTHKPFYWSNSGSMSLYTMSTPYENELGEWSQLNNNENHATFRDSINQLAPLQRDEAFKSKAVENIKNHPRKYFKNWVANLGRLIFSYPFSDELQTFKLAIIPNMFILVFIFFAGVFAIINYRNFPIELVIPLLFILIYLLGSSLVSSYLRMFYITIPFWVIFISYVFTNLISIKIKRH